MRAQNTNTRKDSLFYVDQKGFNIEREAKRLKQYYEQEVGKRVKV